ncbi:uncharacterized protein LOC142971481 isoform X2 [Anarhichas minor]|uniref:uncharacterized protein LOC142971481 isoform X2 n=1 Tax=Anarhichas minor TaxID=65739 RepID=UPI003F73AEE5
MMGILVRHVRKSRAEEQKGILLRRELAQTTGELSATKGELAATKDELATCQKELTALQERMASFLLQQEVEASIASFKADDVVEASSQTEVSEEVTEEMVVESCDVLEDLVLFIFVLVFGFIILFVNKSCIHLVHVVVSFLLEKRCFLRYMQPTGDVPTLDFLKKSTETRDFFQDLKNTDMTAATILNYIKNILRFVDYLRNRLDLNATNSDFRNQCQAYKELVETLRKAISKTNSKDSLSTRYQRFVGGTRSLRDCQEVLRVAEKDFLNIFAKFVDRNDNGSSEVSGKDSDEVSDLQKTYYRYYLEAILVLHQFQRPGAVEGARVG